MRIDADFIAKIPKCRVIVRAGVGFDQIDLEAAGRAGIPVCNTPDYGTSEVADHAIALMLALTRGIVTFHEHLLRDPFAGFDSGLAPLVRRLRRRTFGVVGFGRIGTAAALRAKAFGFRIVGFDPYVSAGTEIAIGIERVGSLEALLDVADVVSLHCPLTAETKEMIGAEAFRRMKPTAILVNTARGQIVDVAALMAAIRSGVIGGAGIDVLPVEPPNPNDEIAVAYRDLEAAGLAGRLILTPHAAWASPEVAPTRAALRSKPRFVPGPGTSAQSCERSLPGERQTLSGFRRGSETRHGPDCSGASDELEALSFPPCGPCGGRRRCEATTD